MGSSWVGRKKQPLRAEVFVRPDYAKVGPALTPGTDVKVPEADRRLKGKLGPPTPQSMAQVEQAGRSGSGFLAFALS